MSEWDHRQLCPDGACIGVIGSDGTCKVCGRAAPNWGDERKRGMLEEPDEDDEDDGEDEVEDASADAVASGLRDQSDGEWDQRQLCPDESCIGVLGRDGKCKVCGRSAA